MESHCIVCSATLQLQICPNLGEAILWDGVDWVDGGEDKASDGNFGLMTRQIHHHHSTFSPPGYFGFVPFQILFCRFGDNVGIPSSLHLVNLYLTFGFMSFQILLRNIFQILLLYGSAPSPFQLQSLSIWSSVQSFCLVHREPFSHPAW